VIVLKEEKGSCTKRTSHKLKENKRDLREHLVKGMRVKGKGKGM